MGHLVKAIAGFGVVLLGACAVLDMPEAPEGMRLFGENCAACHGTDARGAGPETLGIGKVPPDLTRLQAANDGVFPTAYVLSVIDGYETGTHPGRVMPEFGEDMGGTLVPLDVEGVSTPTPRALVAVLRYLEDLQVAAE
ncbi:MAG: c-type cytochrome [Aliishimia sp.]